MTIYNSIERYVKNFAWDSSVMVSYFVISGIFNGLILLQDSSYDHHKASVINAKNILLNISINFFVSMILNDTYNIIHGNAENDKLLHYTNIDDNSKINDNPKIDNNSNNAKNYYTTLISFLLTINVVFLFNLSSERLDCISNAEISIVNSVLSTLSISALKSTQVNNDEDKIDAPALTL